MPLPKLPKHAGVGAFCFAFFACSFSMPYFIRTNTPNLNSGEKVLTGSQRQRGMYMNAGSHDAGLDPDWDPKTNTYNGWKRKEELMERKRKAMNSSDSEDKDK
jgi:hypothetical protein